jgi:hypothetical protein
LTIIQVAAREIDTMQKIGEALVDIVGSLDIGTGILGSLMSSRGCGKLLQLCSARLSTSWFEQEYTIRNPAPVRFHHQFRSTAAQPTNTQAERHLKAGFTTYAPKLECIMSLMHKQAEALEGEANLASQFSKFFVIYWFLAD